MADSDAPIPYDPNDEAAVNAYWDEGIRRGLVTRGMGKNKVVVK